jgi:hypothetical protein
MVRASLRCLTSALLHAPDLATCHREGSYSSIVQLGGQMVRLSSCALSVAANPSLGFGVRHIGPPTLYKISLDTPHLPEYTRAHLLSLVNFRFRCQR